MLLCSLFRKQVVVVTHTNTGAAKQKRRVYFSLPFLLPPFFAIFTNSQLIRKKINNTSFISSIHSQLHTLHYCELSNRYRLSFLICYLLFLVCDADADAHYTAPSTKVARQLKLKLFERLQRHSPDNGNGREREGERTSWNGQSAMFVNGQRFTVTCTHTRTHTVRFVCILVSLISWNRATITERRRSLPFGLFFYFFLLLYLS